jgi:hypothetical protein
MASRKRASTVRAFGYLRVSGRGQLDGDGLPRQREADSTVRGWLRRSTLSYGRAAPAAAYFLQLIEGTQVYVERLATRPDKERLDRIVTVLKEAHARLHARFQNHR